MSLYKKNLRVLVIEPAQQRPIYDKARPNGGLGPAYLVGALRKHGIEVDYLDITVETGIKEIIQKYSTGKYDPEEMDPVGILKSLKKAGIRTRSNFLIGFRDESWESILRTKDFVKELFAEGLDQVKFGIPVPYPGTLDFENEMKHACYTSS